MRCNARNRFAVRLLKLSLHATHIVFQVHCHLRHSGLVQKEESAATIHQRFHFRGRSGFYYTPQRCTNGICHGNIADTAFCFRRCDKVGLFSRPAKLPPDMDTVPFKVDICSCQAIQLTHTQAGSHKNDDIIIIVAAIVLNELQIFLLLFSGQGIAHISVLRHNIGQLELEWILADDVILHRHLKRRSDNALQDSYGVLLETAVMQKHEPAFRIGQFYRFESFLPERVRMNPLDRCVVRPQRIWLQPTFQVHIAVNQISHRHLSGGVVDAVCQIAPQFFLFFPQLCQGFSVNTTPFLVDIGITIVVGAVCSLAFAILQNTALAIFALFRHLGTPFCEKRI